MRPATRTGLGGEKAEAVDGYGRAAVERLGDWPAARRGQAADPVFIAPSRDIPP